MEKSFSIAWNCKTGNYYIYHNYDVNKYGTERERVIYQSSVGYFYKIGKKEIYLTEEEANCLNDFRKSNQ